MRKTEEVSLLSTNSWFEPKRLYLWKEKQGAGPGGDPWIQVLFAQSDILNAADPSLKAPNFTVKAFSQPFPWKRPSH